MGEATMCASRVFVPTAEGEMPPQVAASDNHRKHKVQLIRFYRSKREVIVLQLNVSLLRSAPLISSLINVTTQQWNSTLLVLVWLLYLLWQEWQNDLKEQVYQSGILITTLCTKKLLYAGPLCTKALLPVTAQLCSVKTAVEVCSCTSVWGTSSQYSGNACNQHVENL